jgi:cysteine desulfurase family protein
MEKQKSKYIYFDNAATSYPKPKETTKAIVKFLEKVGANPGRSGHRLSLKAGRIVEETRETLAELFKIEDPLRIIFTHNATYAINMALLGLLEPGDRVITTSLEHNSIARPLRYLQGEGIEVVMVKADPVTCEVDPSEVKKALKKKKTKMVALLHGSNVVGKILPIKEIGKMSRENGAYFLVDTAQTAGCVPIDVYEMNIDLLAFTGHKALFGPMGTGGLYVRPGIKMRSLIRGGTGSRSEEDVQPRFLPDALESGTLNAAGLAGLTAGVKFIIKKGVENIRKKEIKLFKMLLEGLKEIPGVEIYGNPQPETNLAILSFNVKGLEPSEVGDILDHRYKILSRVGLHCSPWAHQTIGTYPKGTVRLSLSIFNTKDEVERAIEAVRKIALEGKRRWAHMS